LPLRRSQNRGPESAREDFNVAAPRAKRRSPGSVWRVAEIVDFPWTAPPRRIAPNVVAGLRADAASLARDAAALRRYGAELADQNAALLAAKDALDLHKLRTRAIVALSEAVERAIETGNLAAMISLKQHLLAFAEDAPRPDAAD
jgi:hypothetical protein